MFSNDSQIWGGILSVIVTSFISWEFYTMHNPPKQASSRIWLLSFHSLPAVCANWLNFFRTQLGMREAILRHTMRKVLFFNARIRPSAHVRRAQWMQPFRQMFHGIYKKGTTYSDVITNSQTTWTVPINFGFFAKSFRRVSNCQTNLDLHWFFRKNLEYFLGKSTIWKLVIDKPISCTF